MKKTVLLTNDDGYSAKGISLLYNILKEYYNVIVVAPDSEKSGVGHSFTYHYPLFYKKIDTKFTEEIYSVSGSPADCVKFAISFLLPSFPDLIISGLNLGENSGISSHYSGTVAAAREGAFWNIRSYAFSVCEGGESFSESFAKMIPTIISNISENTSFLNNSIFFNVNFPCCNPEEVKGIKITRQSMAFFDDKYERVAVNDINGHRFGYKIYGKKKDIEKSEVYDSRALLSKYIAVTPLSFDATASDNITEIMNIEKKLTFKGFK